MSCRRWKVTAAKIAAITAKGVEERRARTTTRSATGLTFPPPRSIERCPLFFVASLKQHVGGRVYANPLLCFSAAPGIRSRPVGYAEPHLYTGLLAAVLWWSRLFFLEAGFEAQPRGLEDVGAEAVVKCQEEFAKWMFVGIHTPISMILAWMAYGRGWRQQMSGQASVRWSEDQQTLFHHGERISVQDFQQTACKLVADAERLLDGLLAGTWGQASRMLAMGRIADSMGRLGAGQSFLSNAKNQWLDVGPGKVLRLIAPSIWDAARHEWKRRGVTKWLRQLRLFREALLLLFHTWGGQPGRGPELMTLRYCDSWQLLRNVFALLHLLPRGASISKCDSDGFACKDYVKHRESVQPHLRRSGGKMIEEFLHPVSSMVE